MSAAHTDYSYCGVADQLTVLSVKFMMYRSRMGRCRPGSPSSSILSSSDTPSYSRHNSQVSHTNHQYCNRLKCGQSNGLRGYPKKSLFVCRMGTGGAGSLAGDGGSPASPPPSSPCRTAAPSPPGGRTPSLDPASPPGPAWARPGLAASRPRETTGGTQVNYGFL